jgi:predicted molibdopterin-dependent oxidoreductase YjgC
LIEGDWVRVESRRGYMDAPVRVSDIRPGLVFAPFHYGYFDQSEGDQPGTHPTAANELTLTEWDPVSKQPYYKFAAVRVTKLHDTAGHAAPAPTNTGSAPARATPPRGTPVPEPTAGGAEAETESTMEGS